jgi:hypothetical protein
VTNHVKTAERVVRAPFGGLILGSLENPVAAPGHPLRHLPRLDRETNREIEREIDRGEFDSHPGHGDAWADDWGRTRTGHEVGREPNTSRTRVDRSRG